MEENTRLLAALSQAEQEVEDARALAQETEAAVAREQQRAKDAEGACKDVERACRARIDAVVYVRVWGLGFGV